ncbi:MAG: 4-hydroxy-tetrahydrodipicolinate reductase [Saprospiraceae bacterium]|nr:4-hydroxy-tetrahydrodipicolinate reductase [Saprospiraceae bacterium]
MRIGLIGYGKMGKAVEQQAVARGHSTEILSVSTPVFPPVDCAIDFSHAAVAPDAISRCLRQGIRVVSGTTGWLEELPVVEALCAKQSGALCWSPNFSIGMHLTFRINQILASLMNRYPQYQPEILEIHHTSKQDSPSGTAIALAGQIVATLDRINSWVPENKGDAQTVGIISQREEDVKGIHRVTYRGPFDTISIRHHALSRDGFALGAVIAAEWLFDKQGCFRFEDVLDFPGLA